MPSRPDPARPADPDIRTASFDTIFRAAAARVLRRRGVPDDQIEAEIERLKQTEPSFRLPTIEELADAPASERKR